MAMSLVCSSVVAHRVCHYMPHIHACHTVFPNYLSTGRAKAYDTPPHQEATCNSHWPEHHTEWTAERQAV